MNYKFFQSLRHVKVSSLRNVERCIVRSLPSLGLLKNCALCIVVCSCMREMVVYEYRHIDNTGWNYRDTLEFRLPPSSYPEEYSLYVDFRMRPTFPYDRFWFVVQQELENPSYSQRDTFCLQFSDSKGVLSGHGIGLMQQEQPCAPLSLTEGQSGKIRIYHIMSSENIGQVVDVGVRIAADCMTRR